MFQESLCEETRWVYSIAKNDGGKEERLQVNVHNKFVTISQHFHSNY